MAHDLDLANHSTLDAMIGLGDGHVSLTGPIRSLLLQLVWTLG